MKIVLVGPRTFNGHLDGIVWNFQLPLQSLGHEVFLLDTVKPDNTIRLRELVEEVNPDLIFSVLSVGKKPPFYEPVDLIKEYTNNSDIMTFNWFCDDIWRFDIFSSDMCHNFNCCSTTEPSFIEKYKDIGYKNIALANWHANVDLYSYHRSDQLIKNNLTFVGKIYRDRKKYLDFLVNNGVKVSVFNNLSFEGMIQAMSESLICLNFSSNPNAKSCATQMKGRMFEIPATGALLLSEYHKGIEDFFEENKEAVYFRDEHELLNKTKKLLDSSEIALRLSKNGFERFTAEHSSQHRLKELLEWINTL